ncbi:GNAT family N-acetyltransferase [Planococcus lenghuensis]|uniref:GNAT family N-acetyltransferase n=1 Tax=Planococcus lenghuensis TaxID=2213202 RepID=A0A1Q2L4D5_9BACL|nr:GNAT family N-acetyltransferase [Planococcus lenghuensis]AQQ55283.1 GNAT family N-acetyltransferase [Planococcus lenghuensis]
MLVKYRKPYKKIAMGLLSLFPEARDLKKLQETMHRYEENANWQLYLWKEAEDTVGVIGVEIMEDTFVIHHLAIVPSHRSEGIGHKMIEQIRKVMGERQMESAEPTGKFVKKYLEEIHLT